MGDESETRDILVLNLKIWNCTLGDAEEPAKGSPEPKSFWMQKEPREVGCETGLSDGDEEGGLSKEVREEPHSPFQESNSHLFELRWAFTTIDTEACSRKSLLTFT